MDSDGVNLEPIVNMINESLAFFTEPVAIVEHITKTQALIKVGMINTVLGLDVARYQNIVNAIANFPGPNLWTTISFSVTAVGPVKIVIEISAPEDITFECGEDTAPASTGMATGNAPCEMISITHSDSIEEGCGNAEIITRTWTLKDSCGNSATGEQKTVVDTTSPTISAPVDITIECTEATDTSHAATGGVATATDTCGSTTVTFNDNVDAGRCGNEKIITRTWTATDECGNTNSVDQTISVFDTTPPTITCPSDVLVSTDAALCTAKVQYENPFASCTCSDTTLCSRLEAFQVVQISQLKRFQQ